MIEVELKMKIENTDQVEDTLKSLGFVKENLLIEKDIYFDNTSHKIKEADEALRIRCCENPSQQDASTYLTYKGPKLDAISKTRKELQMEIESAEVGQEILNALGYTLMFLVEKKRQYFTSGTATACMDHVVGLGDFLELECVVADESQKESALEELFSLVEKLGYKKEDLIRTSYLAMVLAKKETD